MIRSSSGRKRPPRTLPAGIRSTTSPFWSPSRCALTSSSIPRKWKISGMPVSSLRSSKGSAMAHDAERAREPRKLRTPSANGSRYLAISFVTAAALVPIGWGLGASEFYASHSRNVYDALGASAFSVEAISADVVFIGDSSLLTGVRTRQFEKETGLSAYSLALPAGMMYRAPELLLDKYLAANSRPRLIVLYMGAWSQLDSRYQKSIGWFEGVSMLARYAPPPLLWDYVRHQPSVILEYPYLLLSSWWSIFDVSTRPYHALVRKIGDDKGYLLLGDPVSPATMNDNCEHDRGAVASDRASVGAFRARYPA